MDTPGDKVAASQMRYWAGTSSRNYNLSGLTGISWPSYFHGGAIMVQALSVTHWAMCGCRESLDIVLRSQRQKKTSAKVLVLIKVRWTACESGILAAESRLGRKIEACFHDDERPAMMGMFIVTIISTTLTSVMLNHISIVVRHKVMPRQGLIIRGWHIRLQETVLVSLSYSCSADDRSVHFQTVHSSNS